MVASSRRRQQPPRQRLFWWWWWWLLLLIQLLLFCYCTPSWAFVPSPQQQFSLGTSSKTTASLLSTSAYSREDDDDNNDKTPDDNCYSVCVIGGGVSGLTAAYKTAAGAAVGSGSDDDNDDVSIILLEASSTLGGRVRSDYTSDGYILDRGFAVFLEEYPNSKTLLDYDELDLHQFDPGALVRLPSTNQGLARIADPLRQPRRLWAALTSPVGRTKDKIRLIPLLFHVFTKPIDYFFEEEETDTLTCLRERWKFSDEFIGEFLQPFMEGIFLAPLHEQSSRMFHFVFKMFSIGSVSLPRHGMQAVSDQLATKAQAAGVDIRTSCPVTAIINPQEDERYFQIQTSNGDTLVQAKIVILATDVSVTQQLLGTMKGYESIARDLPPPVERKVGCLYYSFCGKPPPIEEPILILNGNQQQRGTPTSPINNCCFPSVVCDSYSPANAKDSQHHLCSVSILSPVLEEFHGQHDQLDQAVRNQLAEWFPTWSQNIQQDWKLEGIYEIPNAQPAQYGVEYPANVNNNSNSEKDAGGGGRDCQSSFRGKALPPRLILAGDHMATSSLNGALGSGMQAAQVASELLAGC